MTGSLRPLAWVWLLAGCQGLQAFSPYVDDKDDATSDDTDPADTDQGGADGVDSGDSADVWADTALETDSPVDTDGGGGAGGVSVPVGISFWQYVGYWNDYLSRGRHELLVGPEGSTDPEDGSWVVVADGPTMEATAAASTWTNGTFDLGPTIAAQGWTRFRVAFHYRGTNADDWQLDDLCLSSLAQPLLATDCDLLVEGFESTASFRLPGGFVHREGQGNQSIWEWEVTSLDGHRGSKSVEMSFSTSPTSTFLVLPPIDVP